MMLVVECAWVELPVHWFKMQLLWMRYQIWLLRAVRLFHRQRSPVQSLPVLPSLLRQRYGLEFVLLSATAFVFANNFLTQNRYHPQHWNQQWSLHLNRLLLHQRYVFWHCFAEHNRICIHSLLSTSHQPLPTSLKPTLSPVTMEPTYQPVTPFPTNALTSKPSVTESSAPSLSLSPSSSKPTPLQTMVRYEYWCYA